eukprot:gene13711-16164_t
MSVLSQLKPHVQHLVHQYISIYENSTVYIYFESGKKQRIESITNQANKVRDTDDISALKESLRLNTEIRSLDQKICDAVQAINQSSAPSPNPPPAVYITPTTTTTTTTTSARTRQFDAVDVDMPSTNIRATFALKNVELNELKETLDAAIAYEDSLFWRIPNTKRANAIIADILQQRVKIQSTESSAIQLLSDPVEWNVEYFQEPPKRTSLYNWDHHRPYKPLQPFGMLNTEQLSAVANEEQFLPVKAF